MESYPAKVVVFGDLLGWSEACQNVAQFSKLKSIVELIGRRAGNFSEDTKKKVCTLAGVSVDSNKLHSSIEFAFFSDSFAISAPIHSIETICRLSAFLCQDLIRAGFLVRGGIAIGDLYHAGNKVFGSALLEAYRLENVRGKPPGIYCSPGFYQEIQSIGMVDTLLYEFEPGEWEINIAPFTSCAVSDLKAVIEEEIAKLKVCSGDQTLKLKKWVQISSKLPEMHATRQAST